MIIDMTDRRPRTCSHSPSKCRVDVGSLSICDRCYDKQPAFLQAFWNLCNKADGTITVHNPPKVETT